MNGPIKISDPRQRQYSGREPEEEISKERDGK
jgi:hypothetical protein